MEREEILLREYEACQSHNNALGQQSWVSISILITVNFLVLAQVIPNLVLTTVPNHGWARPVFVTLLGMAMILILIIFWRWQERIKFLAWLNNDRMQDIEKELDFEIWKNSRVRGLDLYYRRNEDNRVKKKKMWDKLNPKLKKMIKQLSKRYPQSDKKAIKEGHYITLYRLPTTEGKPEKLQFKFGYIFYALMIVWGIVILFDLSIFVLSLVN